MKKGPITVIGTIQIGVWRSKFFLPSLNSVQPVADLFGAWRLNIAGEKRKWAQTLVEERWDDTIITLDDNEATTYELVVKQLESLEANSLVYPWIEDMWFVCGDGERFRRLLDNFKESQASVMVVSHLLSVWGEPGIRIPLTSTCDYHEYEIEPHSQKRIWKLHPKGCYLVSAPSIFKVGFLRRVIEHQKDQLMSSHRPHDLEIKPPRGLEFLRKGNFIRMVPRFHVFREVIAAPRCPPRCIPYRQALELIERRNKRC